MVGEMGLGVSGFGRDGWRAVGFGGGGGGMAGGRGGHYGGVARKRLAAGPDLK